MTDNNGTEYNNDETSDDEQQESSLKKIFETYGTDSGYSIEDITESGKYLRKQNPYLKTFVYISLGLFLVSLILRIVLANNPEGGEFFYRYITRYLQGAFAFVTSFIPFSLGETIVIAVPFVLIVILVLFIKYIIKRDLYRAIRLCLCIIVTGSMIMANYFLNLSMLYCRPSLSQLSGISDEAPTQDELFSAAIVTAVRLDTLIKDGKVRFTDNGSVLCPYTFEELDEKIEKAYDEYSERNNWISPYGGKCKIIALSDYMTYTHISGIYTQYTGETNININYPQYVICSTMAHEKAHQRGIAPEDEANLTAFFVLCESGDPYLEYCGYMSVIANIMSSCLDTSEKLYYYGIYPYIPKQVFTEFSAFSEFFRKYENSTASEVASAANDTYLKRNGESDGVMSYDMITDMAVQYIVKDIMEES